MAPSATSLVFQSAPAITGGRCLQRSLFAVGVNHVSIRARHYWRAMQVSRELPPVITLFQSAPAITGGRCEHQARHSRDCRSFNPRPPLLAGDANLLAARRS